jgi:hypothetical protein
MSQDAAKCYLVGQLQRLGAKPLYADYRDNLVWQNASNCGSGLEIFEAGHVLRGMRDKFRWESLAGSPLGNPEGPSTVSRRGAWAISVVFS